MLLLDDGAGSGDVEATIGIFLDACISDSVCEIAVQDLLVPDPVPSRPVDDGTPFDLKSALGIDVEVPAAAAGSSMSGGAMLDMLSAQVCPDPGSGKIRSPTSDFIFEWPTGPPAPEANSAVLSSCRSDASIVSACDGGATCGSGGGPGRARNSGTSLLPVVQTTVPAHSATVNPRSGPKRATHSQVARLRTLVGLHAAVRALLCCRACGQRGHTMDSAKRVLGVDILLGCPYESCCLCHKVGHAGRDCRSPEPDDLPDLLTAWMCAPWLHHSNTCKVFHPGADDLKAAQAEMARLKTALVESEGLRKAADAKVARLKAERVPAANSVRCGSSGDVEFIVDKW